MQVEAGTSKELYDIDAERHVLGAMLHKETSIPETILTLGERVGAFHAQANQLIYGAVLRLSDKTTPVDVYTLASELRAAGDLGRVGGPDYLLSIRESVPSAANAQYYAEVVRDAARVRGLQQVGLAAAADAGSGRPLDYLLGLLNDGIAEATETGGGHDSRLEAHYSAMYERMQNPELSERVPVKPESLAKKVPAFHPGDLVVVAGETSVGKSALAMNLAWKSCWEEKLPVVYLSLEMTEEQVAQRVTAMLSGVSLSKITNPETMVQSHWDGVAGVASEIEAQPFHVIHSPMMTIDEAMNTARLYHNRYGKLGVVVLDYLQYMRADTSESRNEEVAKYSVRLKQLAGLLHTTVMGVSQLNRQASASGKPELSHLRDSGSIEQDADVVVMIEKPSLDDDDGYGERDMTVHVRKNRQGEVGAVEMTFRPNVMRWD